MGWGEGWERATATLAPEVCSLSPSPKDQGYLEFEEGFYTLVATLFQNK